MASEDEILAAEAERKARWDRVAGHLLALVELGCGGIVDSREASMILEHVAGLEAVVVRLSSMAEAQAQESKSALEHAVSDLGECRAHLRGVLEELGKVRAESGALRARLEEVEREREGLLAERSVALTNLHEMRRQRDSALARLSEPRSEQLGGVVVVELGVRLGVMVR